MARQLNYFKTRPKLVSINTEAYLQRLGLQRVEERSLTYLKKLHRAHLFSIPFENLDIHYGRKIILSIDTIYEKIILNNRGGLCYELNYLFFHMLNQLGYHAWLGSASVYQDEGLTPEYDHMIIIVMLANEPYLIDVGFGNLFTEPKKITTQPQLDYTEFYRFTTDPDGLYILQRSKTGSDYKSVYRFDLKPREMISFLERCNFHQESAHSYFRQHKVVSQLFREGRITLTDQKLKMIWKGEKQEFPISTEEEFLARLEEYFKIDSRKLLSQQLH